MLIDHFLALKGNNEEKEQRRPDKLSALKVGLYLGLNSEFNVAEETSSI